MLERHCVLTATFTKCRSLSGTYPIERCSNHVWYTGNAECDVYLQTAHLAKRHQLKSRPYQWLRRDDGLPLKSYSRGLE